MTSYALLSFAVRLHNNSGRAGWVRCRLKRGGAQATALFLASPDTRAPKRLAPCADNDPTPLLKNSTSRIKSRSGAGSGRHGQRHLDTRLHQTPVDERHHQASDRWRSSRSCQSYDREPPGTHEDSLSGKWIYAEQTHMFAVIACHGMTTAGYCDSWSVPSPLIS